MTTVIKASTLENGLDELKRKFGENALILSIEGGKGNYKIYAQRNSRQSSPITKKEESLERDNEKLIKKICEICDDCHLSYSFCESWIGNLSKKNSERPLEEALEQTIQFDPHWLNTLTPKDPIILVGSHGSGKTSTLAKLAAFLLSKEKKVKVITLDTIKAGGIEQLQSYLNFMKQPLYVGKEHLTQKNEEDYILVDTPGLNPFTSEKEMITSATGKIVLVLSADMNTLEAERMSKQFYTLNARFIIASRLDLTSYYGSFLGASYYANLPLVAYTKNASIGDGVYPFSSKTLEPYLKNR